MARLRTPVAQLVAAGLVTAGGAYLIAVWMVGVVVMVYGLLFAADALLRNDRADDADLSRPQAIFRRYERSP